MSNQVYGYVTEKIIQELEWGCVAWHKPWKTSSDCIRIPTSLVSKKPYRGVNTFLLSLARFKAGYDSNCWLTFKQTQALGGSVKGQHSEMVVFGKLLEKPVENPTGPSLTTPRRTVYPRQHMGTKNRFKRSIDAIMPIGRFGLEECSAHRSPRVICAITASAAQ
jgi:antirestriction protein ArdC